MRQERPVRTVQTINRAPAGSNLSAATHQEPPLSSKGAIAVIADPQSAKGRTISSQRRIGGMAEEEDGLFKI